MKTKNINGQLMWNASFNVVFKLSLMFLFLNTSLYSQYPAGTNSSSSFIISLNTDSVYYQKQAFGWFKFNTGNISNVGGSIQNLKAALIPSSGRVIQNDTVKVKAMNLYDSNFNLIASDTLHNGDTSLVFTQSLSINTDYYIQVWANYPCDSCVYNDSVIYHLTVSSILVPVCGVFYNVDYPCMPCGGTVSIFGYCSSNLSSYPCGTNGYLPFEACSNATITINASSGPIPCPWASMIVTPSTGSTYTIFSVPLPYQFTYTPSNVPVSYSLCLYCQTANPSPDVGNCGCLAFTIYPSPSPNFTVVGGTCGTQQICLYPDPSAIGSSSTYTYSNVWNIVGNNFSFTSMQDIPCVTLTPGTYTINHQAYMSFTSPYSGGGGYYSVLIACDDSSSQVITICPQPTISASASDYSVCSGASTTLTASGTTSYTWYPGGIISNPIVVNPTVTTTYTVIGSNPAECPECVDSAVVTISVCPQPIISVFASEDTICANASTTLTASGATSYTWYPGGITGNPIVVTPTVTTTYTVIGSNTVGCTASTLITVTVYSNCCALSYNATLSGTLTASPSPSMTYSVTSDIIINTSITFSNAEFKMAPGVKIIIANNGFLTISNSHLYACDNMWRGIIIANPSLNTSSNGRILVDKNSLIEDANCAISLPYGSPLTSSIMRINTSTFNKNDTCIAIRNYTLNAPSINSVFTFVNSVCTCRKIPYGTTPPFISPSTQVMSIKATSVSNPGFPLGSPYINNTNYPFTLTNLGKQADIGIYLENSGITLGSAPSSYTYQSILIGGTGINNFNVFDNLKTDIFAVNSNLTCQNNVFQNGALVGKAGVGKGIYAVSVTPKVSPLNPNKKIEVIPVLPSGAMNNKFYDLSRAIETINYFEHDIRNCDIRSTQVNVYGSGFPVPNHTGEYGMLITTNRYHQLNITINKLYNIENAIVFHATFGTINIPGVTSGISFNSQYSGQVTISRNTIRPHLPGYPITSQYVTNAIYLANTIPFGVSFINTSATINVSNNLIEKVYKGIYVANFQKKTVHTMSNCITLSNQPCVLCPPAQFGIYHVNLTGSGLLSNNVGGNEVVGSSISNFKMEGIYIGQSVNENVTCNNIQNTYNGIHYDGVTSPCGFLGNKMQNHTYGYVLSNNAVIGPQGSAGAPSDNQWMGTWMPGGSPPCKTYVIASTASLSPLYVRGTPLTYDPSNSPCSALPSPPYALGNGIIYTSGPIYSCTFAPNICPNISPPPFPISFPPVSPGPFIPLLEKIAQNQIPFPPSTQWLAHQQLYRFLSTDIAVRNASPILQNFYNTNQNSIYQTIIDVETDIGSANLSPAQSKLNTISPQNSIETNVKNFYTIYLNYANTGTISTTDSAALYAMAQLCPHTEGSVVYQARAFYNALYQQLIWFDDNCNASSSRISYSNNESKDNTPLPAKGIQIYPNPNTGSFTISSSKASAVLYIEVRDITSKLIFSGEKIIHNYQTILHLDIQPGTYLIKIEDKESRQTIIEKLMIQ